MFCRVLRFYLNLGVRTAWLAERALAYEQNKLVSLIRMDCYPVGRQGIGGADQLSYDLASLNAL